MPRDEKEDTVTQTAPSPTAPQDTRSEHPTLTELINALHPITTPSDIVPMSAYEGADPFQLTIQNKSLICLLEKLGIGEKVDSLYIVEKLTRPQLFSVQALTNAQRWVKCGNQHFLPVLNSDSEVPFAINNDQAVILAILNEFSSMTTIDMAVGELGVQIFNLEAYNTAISQGFLNVDGLSCGDMCPWESFNRQYLESSEQNDSEEEKAPHSKKGASTCCPSQNMMITTVLGVGVSTLAFHYLGHFDWITSLVLTAVIAAIVLTAVFAALVGIVILTVNETRTQSHEQVTPTFFKTQKDDSIFPQGGDDQPMAEPVYTL